MNNDQADIEDVIATWIRASQAGDVAALADLMTEDVTFLLCGQSPMIGRQKFLEAFKKNLGQFRIEGNPPSIQQIEVSGDLAYCWSHLSITIRPASGEPMRQAGYILTVFKKTAGKWRLHRDANLMTVEKG